MAWAGMPTRQTGARTAFWVQVVPALLYVGAVFIAGTSPQPPTIPLDFSQRDKVLHFLVFGGMAVLIGRALRFGWPAARRGRQHLVAAGVATLLGALLEVWQSFVPGRAMELLDWVSDALGAALATSIAHVLAGRSRALGATRPAVATSAGAAGLADAAGGTDTAGRSGEPAEGLGAPASRSP